MEYGFLKSCLNTCNWVYRMSNIYIIGVYKITTIVLVYDNTIIVISGKKHCRDPSTEWRFYMLCFGAVRFVAPASVHVVIVPVACRPILQAKKTGRLRLI